MIIIILYIKAIMSFVSECMSSPLIGAINLNSRLARNELVCQIFDNYMKIRLAHNIMDK